MKRFKKLCRMTQSEIKLHLVSVLKEHGYKPIAENGFLYAKGDGSVPVLLTAHMDTVHKETPRRINRHDGVMSSPQGIGGDDRCGIYIITKILSETDLRPSILFCEDEEIGGVGSDLFISSKYIDDLKEMKYLIELDRCGKDDAVYYDCDSLEFEAFITEVTGYKTRWGTFSDICNLSPACGVAAVNLSCGYYKQHTKEEYVVISEMFATKDATIKLLEKAKDPETKQYEFVQYVSKYGDYSKWGDYYDRWWNDTTTETTSKYGYGELYIMWQEGERLLDTTIYANSLEAAMYDFFATNTKVCFADIMDYEFY